MSQKLRILIVEDNQVDIRFVNEALKQAGPMNFQIEPVGQLSEALTRLERKGIDLVILDLGLPDSQGMATFRTLRQAAPGIPVIVLTGNDDQDLAIAAVRDGAQDYLIKGQIGGKPLIRAVRYALARRQAEIKIRESEERYRNVVENARDAIFVISPDGTLTSANPACEILTGLRHDEFIGQPFAKLAHPEDLAQAAELFARALAGGKTSSAELRIRTKSAETVTLELLGTPQIKDGQVAGVLCIGRDITERKQAENELRRVNRALRLISLCNQEMMRATDEGALLQAVCRLAVETGGYRMAWVGFVKQDETQTVRPVARAGFDEGYLDTLNVTMTDAKRGHGPTATAIRTGKPVPVRDIATNPAFLPWRAAAIQRGYASSIALPLVNEGRCFGALMIYAGEPDAFDLREIELLTEMANDLAFGIGALRHRAEGRRVEAALRESEARYRALFDKSADGILIADIETKTFKYANPALCRMLGYTEDELRTKSVLDIHPKDAVQSVVAEFEAKARGDKTLATDIPCLKKDGSVVHADINAFTITLDGRPCSAGVFRDITGRKQMERDREQAFQLQQGIRRLHEKLLEPLPLRDKLQLVTETIVRLFDADFCRIWLTQPGDLCEQGCMHAQMKKGPHVCRRREMCLHLLASAGRYTHLDGAGHRRVPYGAYKIGRIAAQQEAKFLVNDVLKEPLVHDHEWAKKLGLVSFAGYRLQSPKGAPLGVLALFAKRPLTAQEDVLLDDLSNATASVLLTHLAEDETRRELAERKRAEEAVRESEERFQTLAVSSPVGIFRTDAQGRTTYVNPRWCEITGLSATDAPGLGWLRAVHPDDREKLTQGWQATAQAHGASKADYRFVRPDGTIVWVMGQAVPEKDTDGHVVGYVGTITDITGRKKADEALRESEERYRSMLEQAADAVFMHDATGRILDVNQKACQSLGYSREELLSKSISNIDPWAIQAGKQGLWGKILAGEHITFESRHMRKDGGFFPVEVTLGSVRLPPGPVILGIARDITERKRADEALRDRETQLRLALDAARMGTWDWDIQTGRVVWSLGHEDLWGYAPGTFPGTREAFESRIHPDDVEGVRRAQQKALEEHLNYEHEHRVLWPDGTVRWIAARGQGFHGPDGKPARMSGVAMDITERKQAEAALRDSEAKFRALAEESLTGVYLIQDGRFRYVNAADARIMGYTPEELLAGPSVLETVAEEDRPRVAENFRRRLAGEITTLHSEFTIVRKDGERRLVEVMGSATTFAGRPAVLGTLQDITERKQAEQKLAESQNFLDRIINAVPDPIFVKDRQHRGVLVNDAFCHLMGLKREELLGKSDHDHDCFTPAQADEFKSKDELVFTTGKENINEETLTAADGTVRFIITKKALYTDEKGEKFIVGAIRDITERKLADQAFERARLLLEAIMEQSPVPILVVSMPDLVMRYINRAAADFLGVSDEPTYAGLTVSEIRRRQTWQDFHSAGAAIATSSLPLARAVSGQTVRNEEFSVIRKDGTQRWGLASGTPIYSRTGELMAALLVFPDITGHKQEETLLAARNAELARERLLLRSLIDNLPDLIFAKDAQSRFILTNTACVRQLGASRAEDVLGKTDADFVSPELAALYLADEQALMQSGQPVTKDEPTQDKKTGKMLWSLTTKVPLKDDAGKVVGLIGVARDITGRKHTVEALKESESRFRGVIESSKDGILFFDGETQKSIFGNGAMAELLGCSRQDLNGRPIQSLHPPEAWAADVEREFQKHLRGQISFSSGIPVLRKDGSVFYADISSSSIMIQGKPLFFAFFRDITGRRQAEQQVKEALAFNRTIISDAAVGIVAFKASGQCVLANEAAARIINGTVPRLLKMDFRQLASWRASGMFQIAEEVLATKESRQCDVNFTSSFGKEVWLVSHLSHFVQNGEPHLLHVFSDVTEQKKLEAQFLRAQRMESIGTLAGGIAHDLNNVLTPLLFSIQLLKEKISDDEGQQILNSLEANVQRGASLVKQVLAFGRGVKGDHILLQVRNIAREIERIVRDTFPKSLRFQMEADPGLWTISGDPTQIHQVMLNLCVNARDAMPDGGKLSLRLDNVTLDAAAAGMHLPARPGPYVVISVEDTGIGIPRENRERIFEPFFTTKEVGKGTGLGLSTTLAIVKSHGGFITCDSEPGMGSTFKVYLPATAAPAAVAAAAPAAPAETPQLPRGHDELVLLADDEAPIRELAQHILECFGYRVLLAINGADAVRLYTINQDEIAVVIIDMAMPVKDGPATVAALQAINPKVKIVGASGLEMKDAAAMAFRHGCGRFVSKPFTAETLLQTLRAILQENAAGPSADNKPKTKNKRD